VVLFYERFLRTSKGVTVDVHKKQAACPEKQVLRRFLPAESGRKEKK
jgi:hypothetical protein